MAQLFHYTTLATRLERSTRTLFVTLNNRPFNNAITLEVLFELESLLSWVMTRVEVNSVCFDSSFSTFSPGIDTETLHNLSNGQLEKIQNKLQKIVFSMMHLPQTIVMDLGDGAQNLALELAIGADVRICSVNANLAFDHLKYGLAPAAGGMSFLPHLVAPSFARKWLLEGTRLSKETLEVSGFISNFYDSSSKTEVLHSILSSIATQAPIQRIQTKLGLFESHRVQLEEAMNAERKIGKASRVSEDWKTHAEPMPAKSMSYTVKLSLVKSEEPSSELPN